MMITHMLNLGISLAALILSLLSFVKSCKTAKIQFAYSAPTLNTYSLETPDLVSQYLDQIKKCRHIYILKENPKKILDPETNKQKIEYTIQFEKLEHQKCEQYLNQNSCFGMCFKNETPNSTLCIDRLIGEHSPSQPIIDETYLSSLTHQMSVCILCDFGRQPKSFQGTYRNKRIQYKIPSNCQTSCIFPTNQ